eukprot:3961589-Karenia_brevis.AAC.1
MHVGSVECLAILAPFAETVTPLNTGRQYWLHLPVHAEFIRAQEVHTRVCPAEAVHIDERSATVARNETRPF